MDEKFYEETVTVSDYNKQKIFYTIFNIFSLVSYAFAIVFAVLVFSLYDFSKGNVFIGVAIIVVTIAFFITTGFLLSRAKRKYCVEFDYTFMSGTVNVSKIINQVLRIDFLSFETIEIDKIGVYNSEEYLRIKSNIDKEIFLTSNDFPQDDKKFYYVYLMKNAERNLYIFESSDTLIKYILKYTNKNAIDKGLL